jgi:hypothetical protein
MATFYRPGDLKPQLQTPLGATLGANTPTADTFGGPEADTVEALTQSNLFRWSVPDPTRAVLVLDR